MSEDLTPEEVRQAVDRDVGELLETAGVREPPVDALALAERHLGLAVSREERKARGARGRKQILLRQEASPEQDQWEAAHAIGEHRKAGLLLRLGVAGGQGRALGESPANLIARRLLVPTGWLADAVRGCGHDLAALKEQFATASHEVIAWRLLDLPEPCVITVVDDGRVYRRRSNAWRVRRELVPAEAECQRWVHEHGRPHVVRRDGWTVQGWPVPHAGTKREVLRSVCDEYAG
jgi:hypothetical protein